MANARFKPGSGCYTCRSCGKQTRETGEGESDIGLCRACQEEADWENIHSDQAHDQPGNADPNCPICNKQKDAETEQLRKKDK